MPDESAPTGFTLFQVQPQLLAKGKSTTRLVKSDILSAQVQVLGSGGENNLHAHKAEDAFWLIMNGRARFYTTDDELVGEFGKNEGLMIGRDVPYWFESASDESLVAIRVAAIAQNEERGRVDYTPRRGADERTPEAITAAE